RRVCRQASRYPQNSRRAAKGNSEGIDEGQTASGDPAAAENRLRHSRARMAARASAPALDRCLAFRRARVRRGFPLRSHEQSPAAPLGAESQSRLSPVGVIDPLSMDEKMENPGGVLGDAEGFITTQSWRVYLTVLLAAGIIYLGCIVSPPSLMDDVDAVQAQIARNMLSSGDWVTPRLEGIIYLEKPPLIYWIIAIFYKLFGVHDWVARIPIALSVMVLAWLTAAFGTWAFGRRVALNAGLVLGTSIGLFLFTRILIPDVILTLTIAIALWGLLRVLDPEEPHRSRWAMAIWASMGAGLLLKGLIAAAFPV